MDKYKVMTKCHREFIYASMSGTKAIMIVNITEQLASGRSSDRSRASVMETVPSTAYVQAFVLVERLLHQHYAVTSSVHLDNQFSLSQNCVLRSSNGLVVHYLDKQH